MVGYSPGIIADPTVTLLNVNIISISDSISLNIDRVRSSNKWNHNWGLFRSRLPSVVELRSKKVGILLKAFVCLNDLILVETLLQLIFNRFLSRVVIEVLLEINLVTPKRRSTVDKHEILSLKILKTEHRNRIILRVYNFDLFRISDIVNRTVSPAVSFLTLVPLVLKIYWYCDSASMYNLCIIWNHLYLFLRSIIL